MSHLTLALLATLVLKNPSIRPPLVKRRDNDDDVSDGRGGTTPLPANIYHNLYMIDTT